MDKKFGNVWESALNRLFWDQAQKNNLSYSHKKSNQWNLWADHSGLVLSFITHSGKMIPCLVGLKKETLEIFYISNSMQVDSWVSKDIKYYFDTLKEIYEETPKEEVVEVRKLIQKKRNKNKQIEGQLNFKDMGWK